MSAARELFETALERDPDNTYVLQAWAVAEGAAGETERARELFERCTEVNPQCAPAWAAWGEVEARVGQLERARHLNHRALLIKASPRSLAALATLERRCGSAC